ncbi:MAG: hypothetical protein HYV95_03825 [Opitutae bacterium]|nr:hypothetical protein [Opitutae bacterium]
MEQRPKITVETLLRLKRAERPSAEFWTGFERELRQKQLTALLERRPWWQNLPQMISRRAYLPIGATAVIAFTLVSVKYYTPSQVAPVDEASGAAPVAQVSAAQTPHADNLGAVSMETVASGPTAAETPVIDDRTAVAASQSLSENIPTHSAELVPWSAPRQIEKPSDRMLVENMAQLGRSGIELTTTPIDSALPATPRMIDVATPVVELAAVSALASKRNRLLAELTERRFTPEPQAPEIVRERLSRRLADPEFAERFSRIGVQGDRVLVKF